MSKLEDDFILACGKAEGDFRYEDDTHIPRCLLKSRYIPSDDISEETSVRLEGNDIVVDGGLTIKDVEEIGYEKYAMTFKSKHADLSSGCGEIRGIIR